MTKMLLFLLPAFLLYTRNAVVAFQIQSLLNNHQHHCVKTSGHEKENVPKQPLFALSTPEVNTTSDGMKSIPVLDSSSSSSSSSSDQQSKMDQFAKLRMLESRLMKLQEDQMNKETNYQERIRKVMSEMDKKEKDLLGKVQYFANQLQQYRFDSQKSLSAAKDASLKQEAALKEEIRSLRLKVDELEGEYSKAKAFTELLIAQKNDLQRELDELKRRYSDDVTEWETRYELEQNERIKEQQKNQKLLEEAKVAAKKREKDAFKDGEEMAEKMKELYATHLADTEQELRDMLAEMEGQTGYIHELESERGSLRKLFTRSINLISTRVKSSVKTALGSVSPSKSAASAMITPITTTESNSTNNSTKNTTTLAAGNATATGGTARTASP